MTNIISGSFRAVWAGLRQLTHKRMTMQYPDVQTKMASYYTYDPKLGVAKAGYKGRHILWLDKCTGCQLCSIACENISQAIEMVKVPTIVKPQNKKSLFPQVDYAKCVFCGLCIAPETPVMTNPDVKAISELSVGDRILTHTGEYKPITKIWDMKYTGMLHRVFVYGKPEALICTADHPILSVQRSRSKRKEARLRVTAPLSFHKPAELMVGDYLVSPIPKREMSTERFVQPISMYKHGKVKKLLDLEASPDLFRLIGYFLAGGHCEGGRILNFSFHIKETYLVRDCSDLLKHFFKKSVIIKRNGTNGAQVVLYSTEAAKFFSQFGIGVQNKKIGDWVFFAERRKQVELVKGFWLGDGCRVRQSRQTHFTFATTSRVLAFQLQQVLGRLGVVATLERALSKHKHTSYHIDVFGKWAIQLADLMGMDLLHNPSKRSDKFHISKDFIYMPIRKIEADYVENYRVMDVTVDGDHTFAPLGLATSNCVDACPFYALGMTEDFNLVSTTKKALVLSPEKLSVPPNVTRKKVEFKIEKEEAFHD